MIVRVFRSGVSDGASPVNYLLSKTDHTGKRRPSAPIVLEGSPAVTVQCIDAITRKYRYVSGAIAFRDNERPSRDQLREVIQAFKATMCPGLEPHEFNSLFVLHEEPGGSCHVHFLVPSVHLQSQRQMNIHSPGEENLKLWETFTQAMNHRLGYEQVQPDPLKLALSDFERRAPGKAQGRAKVYLHKQLTREIRRGTVTTRDDRAFLTDQYGVEVTRQGVDYLSLRFPGEKKARRFRGPLYRQDADYRQLVQASTLSTPFLTQAQAEQVTQTLAHLVARRQALFAQRFKPRQIHRRGGQVGHAANPRTTTTKETQKMKSSRPTSPAPTLGTQHAGEPARVSTLSTQLLSSGQVLVNINSIRDNATQASPDNPNAAAETVHEIEAALASLEDAVNAALADVANAKTPKQRARAEARLSKLMEQKRRLQVRLGIAKGRAVDAASAAKTLS